eukprot:7336091-Prymnesium_polylepis.1
MAGGPGAEYSLCDAGADCADCGSRDGLEAYGGHVRTGDATPVVVVSCHETPPEPPTPPPPPPPTPPA